MRGLRATSCRSRRMLRAACPAVAGLVVLAAAALAQPAPQPPQRNLVPADAAPAAEPAPTAPPPAAMPASRPGFLDALGRWVEDSATAAKSGLDSVGTAIGGLGGQAGGAAKGAADAAT